MSRLKVVAKLNNPTHYLNIDENQVKEFFKPQIDAQQISIVYTSKTADFLDEIKDADYALVWAFKKEFYDVLRQNKYRLKAILTPAAGHDWVAHDPQDEIKVIHGNFHGEMMAESLLSMMYYFNYRLADDIEAQKKNLWAQNNHLKKHMLRNQKAAIVGYGNIGQEFSRLLRNVGMEVIGFRRNPDSIQNKIDDPTKVYNMNQLNSMLGDINHLILILPSSAKNAVTIDHLKHLAPNACLYNLGRGGTISDADVLNALEHNYIKFAGLDVVEQEPLPPKSPIWSHPQILLTPHSSCSYLEYGELFLKQVKKELKL